MKMYIVSAFHIHVFFLSVCACKRERQRKLQKEKQRQRDSERDRDRDTMLRANQDLTSDVNHSPIIFNTNISDTSQLTRLPTASAL